MTDEWLDKAMELAGRQMAAGIALNIGDRDQKSSAQMCNELTAITGATEALRAHLSLRAAGDGAEPVAKAALLDRGFSRKDGVTTPTVLVAFPPDDWAARDAFAANLTAQSVPATPPDREALTDTQRLDWLEAFYSDTARTPVKWHCFTTQVASVGYRAAINAAIAAQEGKS